MSGYYYLATPYSKYKGGLVAAFQEACKAAAHCLKQGIKVYCPIAHTHPIAVEGQMDPLDHTIWLPADTPLMEAAKGLIVVKMDGWQESHGIKEEIKKFMDMDRPISYMEWPAP